MNPTPRRMTRQRAVILQTLQRMQSHPTAEELYHEVRRQLPRVSLGTIYRNLDVLAQSGHVQKLEAGGVQARFDAEMAPHHHVRCRECGRVDDVPKTPGTDVRSPAESLHGFCIVGHRVEFDGICPECRAGNSVEHRAAT